MRSRFRSKIQSQRRDSPDAVSSAFNDRRIDGCACRDFISSRSIWSAHRVTMEANTVLVGWQSVRRTGPRTRRGREREDYPTSMSKLCCHGGCKIFLAWRLHRSSCRLQRRSVLSSTGARSTRWMEDLTGNAYREFAVHQHQTTSNLSSYRFSSPTHSE